MTITRDSPLDWVCVGLNHETTPLEIRDALVMNEGEIAHAIDALRRGGAEESLVLSTCNRTEVYARGVGMSDPGTLVADLLREIKGRDLPAHGPAPEAARAPRRPRG